MDPWNLVFMGSAPFAIPALQGLLDAGYRISAVVTRTDKPVGRGREVAQTPVKRLATSRGLSVLQPRTLREPEIQARLRDLRPDVIVVVAYGRILPPEVLAIPPLGCINVHGSLLPRWRGAAPVQRAVMAGDEMTGVSVMQMDEGLDTGPIWLQRSTMIGAEETAASLYQRLAELGAGMLLEVLRGIREGALSPTPQPEEGVTLAPPLRKEEGLVDWRLPRKPIADLVRGVEPWPGAYSFGPGGQRLRWFPPAVPVGGPVGSADPGTVLGLLGDILWVQAGDGPLGFREAQPAGGRRMSVRELWAGRRLKAGDLLMGPEGDRSGG